MAEHFGTPHFHNSAGYPSIKIAVRQFMCVGVLPPNDHPHVYVDMGNETDIVCEYCSTRFVHDGSIATLCVPEECLYMPDEKAA